MKIESREKINLHAKKSSVQCVWSKHSSLPEEAKYFFSGLSIRILCILQFRTTEDSSPGWSSWPRATGGNHILKYWI